MTVTGEYRGVKRSEMLLVDTIGHGLLMPAAAQFLEVFCKDHDKREY